MQTNHITLTAVVGKFEPRVSTVNGEDVVNFSVDVTTGTGKRERNWFIAVKQWDPKRETLARLHPGTTVKIEGYLDQESWKDKTSGEWQRKFVIVAKTIEVEGRAVAGEPPPQRTLTEEIDAPEVPW